MAWTEYARRYSAAPRHDVAGVPVELIEEFSTRSRDIGRAKDDLVETFYAAHGRHPSNVEVLKLRQQATLATRPVKNHHTLTERITAWRARARRRQGRDPTDWLPTVTHRGGLPALDQQTFTTDTLEHVAAVALDTVATKRATFGHANVLAEVHRQLHGVHFDCAGARLELADRITRLALDRALPLQASAPEPVPAHLLRADASSKLRHRGADRYTTTAILDAETRLLDAATDLTAPAIPAHTVTAAAAGLGEDQAAAVTAIATSGRALDLLVGPAGTGKTTALSALKTAWQTHHGPGSVLGLAPSASAAQTLADELGIGTENTAKWLTEHTRNLDRADRIKELHAALARCSSPSTVHARSRADRLEAAQSELDRWNFRPGQLVLIDEASLAGTLALDTLTQHAKDASTKVVLVGDWGQLGAIDAGGAFHLLATSRRDTPELCTVRRFTEGWEGEASTRLRLGDPSAIDAYLDHDRVHAGTGAEMLNAVFDAWRQDADRGLNSAMIAPDDASVAALNGLAQAHRRDVGKAQAGTVRAADGHMIGIGDLIVTRRNDRRLGTSSGWVKNGDTWTVESANRDVVTAVNAAGERTTLPGAYVEAHVELGYATTLHRAQGSTVDSAHALIAGSTTRDALYVAATRARHANHLYVNTVYQCDAECSDGAPEITPARASLTAAIDRSASEVSAHSALNAQPRRHGPSGDPMAGIKPPSVSTSPSFRQILCC